MESFGHTYKKMKKKIKRMRERLGEYLEKPRRNRYQKMP